MTETTPGPPKATLADVAARASVSMATASKVARGRPEVAAQTRARVEEAISELGYRTPERHFDTPKPSIAFLADVINSAYAMEILRGAMMAAEEHDIDLVVQRTHRDDKLASHGGTAALTHRLLSANRIGAVVLTASIDPELYENVLNARLPMVVIDPLDSSHPDVISVGATNWLGGRSAAEHLISLGHSRLGVLSGPSQSLSAMARLDGFLSACTQAGITLSEPFIRQCAFAANEARLTAIEWFRGPGPRPTAIMTGSDSQAMGVLQAAAEFGLTVPTHLSIISYDDTPLAVLATPPLSAVHQPLTDMGRRAVETVLLVHRKGKPEARHIEIATMLVLRDSTAAVPST